MTNINIISKLAGVFWCVGLLYVLTISAQDANQPTPPTNSTNSTPSNDVFHAIMLEYLRLVEEYRSTHNEDPCYRRLHFTSDGRIDFYGVLPSQNDQNLQNLQNDQNLQNVQTDHAKENVTITLLGEQNTAEFNAKSMCEIYLSDMTDVSDGLSELSRSFTIEPMCVLMEKISYEPSTARVSYNADTHVVSVTIKKINGYNSKSYEYHSYDFINVLELMSHTTSARKFSVTFESSCREFPTELQLDDRFKLPHICYAFQQLGLYDCSSQS